VTSSKERPSSKKVADGISDKLALLTVHEEEVVDGPGNHNANDRNPKENANGRTRTNL
jgi:hypothetical protein